MRAASPQKWLEMHGLEHWTHFYTDYGLAIQKRFFGHFLKGEHTGWEDEPPVRLQVRHADRFVERTEREWPIARTRFTRLHLQPQAQLLAESEPAGEDALSFDATGDGVTFVSAPFAQSTEITGPVAAKLTVSSSTTDADLFLVLRVFTPDLREVTFAGAIDPHTPVAQGWLRASHRALDAELTREWRPYHTHRAEQKLVPGVPVQVDVELWPTSIVVPAGCRIALSVRGRDYVYAETTGELQERAARLRPVPARRPARPAAAGIRRPHHPALRPRAARVAPAARDPAGILSGTRLPRRRDTRRHPCTTDANS
jgi:hypothetical protein